MEQDCGNAEQATGIRTEGAGPGGFASSSAFAGAASAAAAAASAAAAAAAAAGAIAPTGSEVELLEGMGGAVECPIRTIALHNHGGEHFAEDGRPR